MFPRKIVSLLWLFCLWQMTLTRATAQNLPPNLKFGATPDTRCESGGPDLLFNGELSVVVDGVIQDCSLFRLQIELAPVARHPAANQGHRFQISFHKDQTRNAPAVQWREIGETRKLIIKGVPASLLCADIGASVSGCVDVELTFIHDGPGRLVISPHQEAGSNPLFEGDRRVCFATPLAGQRFYYVLH
jgi:hypothetical protein